MEDRHFISLSVHIKHIFFLQGGRNLPWKPHRRANLHKRVIKVDNLLVQSIRGRYHWWIEIDSTHFPLNRKIISILLLISIQSESDLHNDYGHKQWWTHRWRIAQNAVYCTIITWAAWIPAVILIHFDSLNNKKHIIDKFIESLRHEKA